MPARISIEGFWSKVAWGLRERGSERRRRKWAHDRRARRSAQFAKHVGVRLDGMDHAGGIGLTQLEWAPGQRKPPFAQRALHHVRPRRYRVPFGRTVSPGHGGRLADRAAGEGLLGDIQSRFTVQRAHSVPSVDFGGRFEHGQGACVARRSSIKRGKNTPRHRNQVVTPEKGLRMYQHLLPRLLKRWPEAEVHQRKRLPANWPTTQRRVRGSRG